MVVMPFVKAIVHVLAGYHATMVQSALPHKMTSTTGTGRHIHGTLIILPGCQCVLVQKQSTFGVLDNPSKTFLEVVPCNSTATNNVPLVCYDGIKL